MPKVKKNKCVLIQSWIQDVGDKYLVYDGQNVYCKACTSKEVNINYH